MNKLYTEMTDDLLDAVISLKTAKEAEKFFGDLLTESELLEFGKRWKAARMLSSTISYSQIIETTGLSSTTVARISKWLKKGKGGYRLVLKKMSKSSLSEISTRGHKRRNLTAGPI